MSKMLFSGNEAVARGAYEAGVRVAAAYPGTPSTEILENLACYDQVASEWSPNEKVALDVAIGSAYAGSRAMAVMKHVGLNVAADAFFYISMTGVEAGLVIISADDPSMHSSQNEQDNRRYAKFARVPCIEPSDSQEAKDMVGVALDMSEQFDSPVMLRLTTRICHSHTLVETRERTAKERETPPKYRIDRTKYVMVPGNARRRHPIIEERIEKLKEFAESFPYNRVEMSPNAGEGQPLPGSGLGIITSGVAYQYAKEVFPHASFIKLGMVYPLPERMIREFAAQVDRLIVVEELDPFLEEEIRLMGIPVEGKSIFPICGEFSPTVVRENAIRAGLLSASAAIPAKELQDVPSLPMRPPLLCPGCPHRGVFSVTNKLGLVVNGDIGCYTLGFLPPLSALHTTGCMGASIGVAHGVSKAGIQQRNVAVLGDSTFFHSGMPALLNMAYNKGNLVTIILDNRTTAMTGHQEHPGTGHTLQGEETLAVSFEAMARAMGVKHVRTVDPYDLDQVEEVLRSFLELEEPAVIVAQRECALLPEVRQQWKAIQLEMDLCIGCGLCFDIGCPAIVEAYEVDPKEDCRPARPWIDPLLCTGCEICAQVCERDVIYFLE